MCIASVLCKIWCRLVSHSVCRLFSVHPFDPLSLSRKPGLASVQLLGRMVFSTLPHMGLGKPFEDVAVAWIWTSLSIGETCFTLWPFHFLHGIMDPDFSHTCVTLPVSLGYCSFVLLCCCFILFFLKTWFSWALLIYNTKFVDRLFMGKSHTHGNWEKINSWSPKKLM